MRVPMCTTGGRSALHPNALIQVVIKDYIYEIAHFKFFTNFFVHVYNSDKALETLMASSTIVHTLTVQCRHSYLLSQLYSFCGA